MEENVALDSKKQKTFVKSIRGIKKLIKKNEKIGAKTEPKKKDEESKPAKPFSMRLKDGKVTKKKRKDRGLVYLSHIPHGFYEHQMTQYFKQFGVVTNARVIKSKRTGNSKGFAFVEFKEPSVAQIVAETMNNYLMGKRLIKAAYIPPEKQKHRAFRKHWNAINNPTNVQRLKLKKAFNADKDESGDLKKAKKLLSNLNKTKKRLGELGVNYDFFLPVDIPETLLDQVIKKEKAEDTVKEENESIPKKGKKEKAEQKGDKIVVNTEKSEQKGDKKVVNNEKAEQKGDKKVVNNKKAEQKGDKIVVNNEKVEQKGDKKVVNKEKAKNDQKAKQNEKENKPSEVNKKVKPEAKKEIVTKENKKNNKPVKVNDKQQKEKEQKLKDAGVKSVAEFISLDAEGSDESDCDFDSDEYEKMLENEDNDLSSGASDESGDEDDSGDEEESGEEVSGDEEDANDESEEEEVVVPKKAKGKPQPPQIQLVQTKKQKQKQQPQKQQVKKQELKVLNEVKRKAPQKPPVSTKKPKFEKQNQKPLKKQFKKK